MPLLKAIKSGNVKKVEQLNIASSASSAPILREFIQTKANPDVETQLKFQLETLRSLTQQDTVTGVADPKEKIETEFIKLQQLQSSHGLALKTKLSNNTVEATIKTILTEQNPLYNRTTGIFTTNHPPSDVRIPPPAAPVAG